MKTTTISKSEWSDYYSVQRSGRINMWLHPLIHKFAPGDNYDQARKWFLENGNTKALIISEQEEE